MGAKAVGARLPKAVTSVPGTVATAGFDQFSQLLELANRAKAAAPKPSGFGNPADWQAMKTKAGAQHAAATANLPPGFNPETVPTLRQSRFISAETVPGEYPTGLGAPRYSFVDDAFNPEAVPPAVDVPTKFLSPSPLSPLEQLVKEVAKKGKKKPAAKGTDVKDGSFYVGD